MPVSNPMIYDSNVKFGYKDKMFDMLGRNVDYFVSLHYFSWYDAFLKPYYMYVVIDL